MIALLAKSSSHQALAVLDERAGRKMVGHLRAQSGVLILAALAVLATRIAPLVSSLVSEQMMMFIASGAALFRCYLYLSASKRSLEMMERGYLRRAASALSVGTVLVCGLIIMTNRSLEGLTPRHIGRTTTSAYLVSDPVRDASGIGVSARIKVDGKHLRATAFGQPGTDLARRSAGETIVIVGTIKSWSREPPAWAVGRHLAGTLSLSEVRFQHHGSVPARLANVVRFRMKKGAESLPRLQRGLFMGFVLGDNRDQSVEVADDFRAAGLSHLLVVSGQNVAFVLVAADPVLRRLGAKWRFVFSLAVLVCFGLVTRFEPSVMRAGSMAALTLWSRHLGRPQPVIRILCLSVIALLLIDPLLSRSVGFALSVLATSGLALLSAPIERRLPFRRSLSGPLSATLAAQIATFPLLVGLGGVHPMSIAANLIALPLAEPVMVWGVLIGVLAGYVGPLGAAVLHAPSLVSIWFIASVARISARLVRLAWLPNWWPILVVVVVGLWWLSTRRLVSLKRRAPLLLSTALVGTLLAVHLTQDPTNATFTELADAGFETHVSQGRVVAFAHGRMLPGAVLQGLRQANVNHVDVLIVSRDSGQTWRALQPIRARIPIDLFVVAGQDSILEGTPILGLRGEERAIIEGWEVSCPKSTCTLTQQGSP